jgi:hypothetical protein
MIWSFFLSGLVLGLGVCSLHCSLFLAPVTARVCSGWRGGLATALLFGLGKSTAMAVYGGLAVMMGLLVYDLFSHRWISFVAGMAVAAVGVWFLLYSGSCGRMSRRGSPFLLGLVDGAVPCGATTGFLLYLAAHGGGIPFGVASGLVFGIGTMTGPVLVVCGITPRLWRRLAGKRKAQLALRVAGSAVFFFWALLLLTGGTW